jgi:thiol-disulfide isomerase/thioredoxin
MNEAIREKKPGKSLKRELIEWGILIFVIAFLYLSGLHTIVIGGMQSLVLKTGLIRPKTDNNKYPGEADYNFILVDQTGKSLDVSTLKGKVIFLNFWATWCPPCVAEMPDINHLYQEVDKENIVFLMVSMDEDFAKAKKFAEKRRFSFNVYRPVTSIPAVFSGNVIPSTYIISPRGKILVKKEGMAQYNTESFREFLKSL